MNLQKNKPELTLFQVDRELVSPEDYLLGVAVAFRYQQAGVIRLDRSWAAHEESKLEYVYEKEALI